MNKKAQASAAAALIAIVAALIVLYIIFNPPEERAKILGEPTTTPGQRPPGAQENLSLLLEYPGTIFKQDGKEIEHLIPSLNLGIKTEAAILKSAQSMFMQRALFKDIKENITFDIEDVDDVENALLNFYVKESSGRLIITLNEKEIYNSELAIGNIEPIKIIKENLKNGENILEFSASSIGILFWKSNEYTIESIQITADLISREGLSSENIFLASENEKENLDEVYLKFVPECIPAQVGKLNVEINTFNIYSAIPDCGKVTPNIYFSPAYIKKGENIITFQTDKGNYIIDLIKLMSRLKEARYPVYYFQISDKYFTSSSEEDEDEEDCGDIDGICPDNCNDEQDPDCCFESGKYRYWCDVKPSQEEDRCVKIISSSQCRDCKSGYEDEDGDPPEECEGKCGDDTDNDCPTGCSKFYDKDCCFEEDEDNFWCDHVPKNDLDNTCEVSLSESEYDDCTTCYYNDRGDKICPEEVRDEDYRLKTRYEALLKLKFIDDTSDKRGIIVLNNRKIGFDQTDIKFEKNVDNYLERGNNALRIEPEEEVLEIAQLEITLEED